MGKLTPLKLTILEEGLTQKELARRAKIDESIISLISNGKYVPDQIQRAKIARALGMNEAELFGKNK
jgi:transcriptional regulator with XRE-family HTH domain